MAFSVRRGTDAVLSALVAAHNETRRAIVGSFFHADVTSDTTGDHIAPQVTPATITAPNATDLASSLVLVNQIRARWLQHRDDDLAHKAADGLPALSAPVATDLASAITLANELKADYEAHRESTTYHYNADSTNSISAADANDQATLNTLLNELKADINAHIQSAPAGHSIKLLPA